MRETRSVAAAQSELAGVLGLGGIEVEEVSDEEGIAVLKCDVDVALVALGALDCNIPNLPGKELLRLFFGEAVLCKLVNLLQEIAHCFH